MEELTAGAPGPSDGLATEQAQELVLRLIGDHADSLLRVARRHSICVEDAQDAYQRGLEILVRHAWRLDPDRAVGWLHTVVRREAVAVNRARRRYLGSEAVDVDGFEASTSRSPEEAVLGFERVQRSAAALRQLKPQELRALWLKALGYSYEEICDRTQWTYTKVNRCLAEGRKSFMERYAGIEAGEECQRLAPALSALVDGEAGGTSEDELRAHLRHCLACRTVVRELRGSASSLAAVFPLGGLVVAEVAEPASHFAVRIYEAVVMGLNERAANSMLRAQAVIEAVTTTKVAAVAASAVAMTGSGLAVRQAVHGGVRHAGVALAPVTPKLGAAAQTKPKATPHAVTSTARTAPPSRSRPAAPVEHRASASQTATKAPSSTSAAVQDAGSASGEFSFESD